MSLLHLKTQNALETLSTEAAGVIGIHAFDPAENDIAFAINADEVFPTASMIKVAILLEFYNQVAAGEIDPDEIHQLSQADKVGGSGILQYLSEDTRITLEDWVKLMINLSDNTATNYLIDIVSMDKVNALLERLGLEKTKLLRKMQATDIDPEKEENFTTPREFSQLMMMVLNHYGLDAVVCENTLKVLRLPKDSIIRDAIPMNFMVANKSGWMDAVQCDTSIVYAEKPYIVTVMAKNIPAWDRNGAGTRNTLKQSVMKVHDYFQNIATSTRYGRRVK